MLVTELRPFDGNIMMVITVLGILAWRSMRGPRKTDGTSDPMFMLAALCWVSGFVVRRFWFDWGMPALMVWMTKEFQEAFKERTNPVSPRRIALTLACSVTLYLAVTNDLDGRWTKDVYAEYLSLDNPHHAKLLPDPGGIMYHNDMRIFFRTFYKNPAANWRYILGFEAAMMPPEDLD